MHTTGATPQQQQQYVVIVWKTEGIGFDEIIGPFSSREEAMARRLDFPVATASPLTAPEDAA